MDGLKTLAKYAYSPNLKGYCGRKGAHIILMRYIKTQSNPADVIEQIDLFQGLPVYLKYISGLAGLSNNYREDVARAYFIGSKLLVEPDNHTLVHLIGEFQKRGLPNPIVADRINKLPKQPMYLHHSFDVYMSGIDVRSNIYLNHAINCLVLPARVKKIRGDKLEVMLSVPDTDGNWQRYASRKEVDYIPEFIPHVKEDNIVSVHWNQAIDKLTEKQELEIEKFTTHNLRIMMN